MVAGSRLEFPEYSVASPIGWGTSHDTGWALALGFINRVHAGRLGRHMGTIWVIGLWLGTRVLQYQKKSRPTQLWQLIGQDIFTNDSSLAGSGLSQSSGHPEWRAESTANPKVCSRGRSTVLKSTTSTGPYYLHNQHTIQPFSIPHFIHHTGPWFLRDAPYNQIHY